jgi:hypothetical protein
MSVLPNSSSPDSSPIKRRKPWKEIGYRGFSAFLASDNDFLVFRHFGAVNARLLLYLQDEIAVLEQDLEELEILHSQDSAVDIHNGSFRQETLPQRKKLLDNLLVKVKEYSKRNLPDRQRTQYSPPQTTSSSKTPLCAPTPASPSATSKAYPTGCPTKKTPSYPKKQPTSPKPTTWSNSFQKPSRHCAHSSRNRRVSASQDCGRKHHLIYLRTAVRIPMRCTTAPTRGLSGS